MMKELTSNAQQCAIHLKFGFLPVFMVRRAVPDKAPGWWKWGRWRYARLTEVVDLNSRLMGTWRD
jgi:hypothetical protein